MSTVGRSQTVGSRAKRDLSDEKIWALLAADASKGNVPVSRGNKINRSYYAAKLGCTPSALTRFRYIFEVYERRLNVVTGPMRRFKEMRRWLESEYYAGRIGLRGGKLDRRAFCERFNLRGGTTIVRYAEIRALFDDFDTRASVEKYTPRVLDIEIDRLKSELSNKPPINKDRKSLDISALAKLTNITRARLLRQPFLEIIKAHQAKLSLDAKNNRLDPLLYGRVYAFSFLSPHWPTKFLERVATRFKQFGPSLSKSGLKRPYSELIRLLTWIGTSSHPTCQALVSEANSSGRIKSADLWEDALFLHRDTLISRSHTGRISDTSIDSSIKALRVVLSGLASGGTVPETSSRLLGIKNARRRSGRVKSVAEGLTSVPSEANKDDANRDYVEFARLRLREVAKAGGLDLGMQGADGFCACLAAELDQSSDRPSDVPTAIRCVLEKRLQLLHNRAKAIVADAIESSKLGSELLANANIDIKEFETSLLDGSLTNLERSRLIREFFPDPRIANDKQVRLGTANILRFIHHYYEGRLPALSEIKTGLYGAFLNKRLLEYGGLAAIEPLLGPTGDAVAATLTLYLIDSGSNVDVGRNLSEDCLTASDQEGYIRISGSKARAKGKPIIVDLPNESISVQALDWLARGNGRSQDKNETGVEKLFQVRIGSRFQLITDHWYTNWFKRFASGIPGLETIGLVPSMIRPSVLLLASLSNDGRLMVGIAQGQHALNVSQGYQQKWPTRLLYDENIKRFQNAFETIVMSGIEDAASKLGLSGEQFEKRLGDLRATGLGTFCKERIGQIPEGKGACSKLDCWDDCPHLVIIAEVEAIASLQLWQTSLRAVRPEWERDRPERWDEVWLPWLCLTDVVEEKMVRGPMIKTWKAAQKRAAEISASPHYTPPRPW